MTRNLFADEAPACAVCGAPYTACTGHGTPSPLLDPDIVPRAFIGQSVGYSDAATVLKWGTVVGLGVDVLGRRTVTIDWGHGCTETVKALPLERALSEWTTGVPGFRPPDTGPSILGRRPLRSSS